MFAKLRGAVDAVGLDEVVLDVGGVGYLVQCGARTLARLPAPGGTVTLHIETQVREDAFRLFGFASENERAWFTRLQAIQGVGAKAALAILDTLEPAALMQAAAHEDTAAVSRAKGVGPKLAARVIVELKGKPAPPTRFGGAPAGPVPTPSPGASASAGGAQEPGGQTDYARREEAVSALTKLGIDDATARAAVTAAEAGFAEPPALDVLLKAALKEIGR